MISMRIFTNFHNFGIYVKRVHISPKVRLYYIKYLMWDQFSQQLWKMVTLQKCEKSILDKQVSNELAFFHSGLTFKKVIARLETIQKKCDFSVVADAHAHPRDTWVPLPHPHEERSVKEICRTIREKVRVMVEEVGVGYVCLQSWFEGGRAKISTMAPGAVTRGGRLLPSLVPMFNKNEEKGYFSQSCVVHSADIV